MNTVTFFLISTYADFLFYLVNVRVLPFFLYLPYIVDIKCQKKSKYANKPPFIVLPRPFSMPFFFLTPPPFFLPPFSPPLQGNALTSRKWCGGSRARTTTVLRYYGEHVLSIENCREHILRTLENTFCVLNRTRSPYSREHILRAKENTFFVLRRTHSAY